MRGFSSSAYRFDCPDGMAAAGGELFVANSDYSGTSATEPRVCAGVIAQARLGHRAAAAGTVHGQARRWTTSRSLVAGGGHAIELRRGHRQGLLVPPTSSFMEPISWSPCGAREGNRTLDLRITSALLCRLSYPGLYF